MPKAPEPAEKRGPGRPKSIPWPSDKTEATLRGAGSIMCTTKECAALFQVAENTYLAFIKDNPDAREIFDQAREGGKASLRRQQFELSKRNATMSIWLGKQYLGQRDEHTIRGTGPGGAITVANVDISGMNDEQLALLEQTLGSIALQEDDTDPESRGGGTPGEGESGEATPADGE